MEATREIIEGMVRAFPEELAEVNLPPRAVLEGATSTWPLFPIAARRVFGGWADLVHGGYREAHARGYRGARK